jgi:hypothetical protein
MLGQCQHQFSHGEGGQLGRPDRYAPRVDADHRVSECAQLSSLGISRHRGTRSGDRRYIPRPPRPRPSRRGSWIRALGIATHTSRPGPTRSHRSRPSQPLPEAEAPESDAHPRLGNASHSILPSPRPRTQQRTCDAKTRRLQSPERSARLAFVAAWRIRTLSLRTLQPVGAPGSGVDPTIFSTTPSL